VAEDPSWAESLVLVTKAVLANSPIAFLSQWELEPQACWDRHRAALCQAVRPWRQSYQLANSKLQAAVQLRSKFESALQVATTQHDAAAKRLQTAEQRMAQLTLSVASSTSASAGVVTAVVTPATTGGPTFEAYRHPKWPAMLVTPGTLVVLMHLLLIQVRCRHAPGSSSLRTNPPQQGSATSLARYGQLFQEAARVRGYADPVGDHITMYLQGLADPELRLVYGQQQLAPGATPHTTLKQVITEVERIAAGLLEALARAAHLGSPEAIRAFEAKQRCIILSCLRSPQLQAGAGAVPTTPEPPCLDKPYLLGPLSYPQ
jgi:hypothetical protein